MIAERPYPDIPSNESKLPHKGESSELIPNFSIEANSENKNSDYLPIDTSRQRVHSTHADDTEEILEEVQKNDKKLIIHRRKVDVSDNSFNGPTLSEIKKPITNSTDKNIIQSVVLDSDLTNPIASSSPNHILNKDFVDQTKKKNIYSYSDEDFKRDTSFSEIPPIAFSANGDTQSDSTFSQTDSASTQLVPLEKSYQARKTYTKPRLKNIPTKISKTERPNSTFSLYSQQFEENQSSKVSTHRFNTYGRSSYNLPNNNPYYRSLSISADSSVSNMRPSRAFSTCSCATLERNKVLQKITEEMEMEHKQFSIIYDKKQRCIKYMKCVTIFLIVLLLIVCILAGILHFYISFFTQSLFLNQGDVKLVDQSSLFCGEITGISQNSGVRVITFQKTGLKKSIRYTRNDYINLSPYKIWTRKFYFLKDSILYIEIATDVSVEVLTFVGKRNYTIWEQRQESDTYLEKVDCCRDIKEKKKSLYLVADRDAVYFVAIKSKEQLDASVNLKFEFDRKTYDFSQTTTSCVAENDKPCTVEYSFNANDDIAIEVPLVNEPNGISKTQKIEWKCSGRIWFYFALFLGVFLVLFLLILFTYCISVRYIVPNGYCVCVKDQRKKPNFDSVECYDNQGRANSEIAGGEDIYIQHSDITRRHNDNISRVSATSHYLGTLFDTRSTKSTMSRAKSLYREERLIDNRSKFNSLPYTSKKSIRPEKNIAAIYDDSLYIEQADSGISEEPEMGPNKIYQKPSLNAHELMELQELRFQRLKYLRNQQRQTELVNAPSVKYILSRPASVQNEPIYNLDNQQYLNLELNSSTKRPFSVMSERNYYKADSILPSNIDINKEEFIL